jgi:hypothetical protein
MEKEKENEIKLPEAVAKIYKPAPGAVRKNYVHSIGEVDLNSITIKVAEKLVSKGLLTLVKEEKKS